MSPGASPLYRNYVLFMLTFVYVFNFIDRQLLVILQESIKKDLHLSDSQLGWLSGFAFVIFYVTLGIPIARLADTKSRRKIIAIALGLWSIMSALSGTARTFIQLLLARIGVGVGEAGGSPPAHAMISDYFPPERRSTALSIYSTGIYIGVLIGFMLGGYLSQHLGWRTAFFAVSSPGIVFALLFYATVKEPRRGATDVSTPQTSDTYTFQQVVTRLYSNKTFVYLCLATALHVFCIYGLMNWAGSFLGRIHNMSLPQRGAGLGLALGIGGAMGSYAGGALTDRYGKRDIRWYLKLPAYAILLSIFFAAGAIFLKDNTLSVICFGCTAALQSAYLGPAIAVAHSLVPAPMRALTSAILFFVLNLVGQGLGPITVGFISDMLKPSLGLASLRWAMSINLVVAVAAVAFFFITAKTLTAPPPRRSSDRSH